MKTYRSEALAAVHEMMEGFHTSGSIDTQTMREFDYACLKDRNGPFEKEKSRLRYNHGGE